MRVVAESTADILARLRTAYHLHAVSAPATVTRKPSDTPAPTAGDRGSALKGAPRQSAITPNSYPAQRIKRPGTGGPSTFRPNAEYLAGGLPATTVPSAPSVKPVSGRRIDGPATVIRKKRRVPSDALLRARANSEDNGYRAWMAARTNLERDAGDVLPAGSHYPVGRTASGRLARSARY